MLHPITFSIPKEKICEIHNIKNKILSNLIPGDINTYIYIPKKNIILNINNLILL